MDSFRLSDEQGVVITYAKMNKLQMLVKKTKRVYSTMSKKQKNDKTLDRYLDEDYYKHKVNYFKN